MIVEKDKVVTINYTLTGDDGNLIDTSVGKEPLEYIHGNGYLLPKLEEQLEGKNVGDKIKADLSAKDGYGEYNDKLVAEVPRDQFDTDMEIEVGMAFQAQTSSGPQIVTVTKVTDEAVTVDANHELAGVNLHFDVEILGIREATGDELQNGLGGGCCGGGCGGCGGGCGGDCEGGCGGCGN